MMLNILYSYMVDIGCLFGFVGLFFFCVFVFPSLLLFFDIRVLIS
jgi:hypothetical protein